MKKVLGVGLLCSVVLGTGAAVGATSPEGHLKVGLDVNYAKKHWRCYSPKFHTHHRPITRHHKAKHDCFLVRHRHPTEEGLTVIVQPVQPVQGPPGTPGQPGTTPPVIVITPPCPNPNPQGKCPPGLNP